MSKTKAIAKPSSYVYEFMIVDPLRPSVRPRSLKFKLANEIVPPGEDAKTFAGYPTFFHALAVANTLSNIGLIYQLQTDPMLPSGWSMREWFGGFLVFDTGVKPLGLAGRSSVPSIIPAAQPAGVLNVQLTRLFDQPGERNWSKRVSKDLGKLDQGKIPFGFWPRAKSIALDFTRWTEFDLFANPDVDREMDPERRDMSYVPFAFNIDLGIDGYGQTILWDWWSSDEDARYCDSKNLWPISPLVRLMKNAFVEHPHEFFFQNTMAHETLHVHDYQRLAYLLSKWKGSYKKGRSQSFVKWVGSQAGRAGSRVTVYDHLNAKELCRTSDGIQAGMLSHWRVHFEGWMMAVNFAPAKHLLNPPANKVGPAATDIAKVDDYYPSSYLDKEFLSRVKKLLAPRLARTYERLGPDRQKAVRDQVVVYYTTLADKEKQGLERPLLNWLKGLWKIDRWG
jgi:hypothetical protein